MPATYHEGYVPSIHHASELDAHYWKNMFLELGFGDSQAENARNMSQADSHQLPYHMHPIVQPMHPIAQPTYGH